MGCDLRFLRKSLFQALTILHYFLIFFRLIPEIRIGNLLLELIELGALLAPVKDSSAQRRPAGGAQRTLFPILPVSLNFYFSKAFPLADARGSVSVSEPLFQDGQELRFGLVGRAFEV